MIFPEKFENQELNNKWIKLLKIRDICNLSIEEKRAAKIIGSSLEASLEVGLGKNNFELVKSVDLAELCITSSAIINLSDKEEIKVKTIKSKGKKCPVCWKISLDPCPKHS